jgi:hypothetical protein
MPGVPLTPPLAAKLAMVFAPGDAAEATRMLVEECGLNLPLVRSEVLVERVRCAVVKLSRGSLERLTASVRDAQRDWRDVLVWADFGNDLAAHLRWMEEQP